MKPIDIRWESRYSETDQPDKHGRWARIAHAGKFENSKWLETKKIDRFMIAWVKKVYNTTDLKPRYIINYHFPSHGEFIFSSFEEAKKEVEKQFNFFIKNVTE